jgi:DNA-binding response OmpR family regulator
MLTARVSDTEKILGLEIGADDYITKPFNPHEVVARVRAVLRRTQPEDQWQDTLYHGQIMMHLSRHQVTVGDEAVSLTPSEFKILRCLMERPGSVFSRSELVEKALGYDYESLERTLDNHVRNLRKKIEPDPNEPTYIKTVYGLGYRLEGEDA